VGTRAACGARKRQRMARPAPTSSTRKPRS